VTHWDFWAGVFPAHARRCPGALRSTALEQYEYYGVFAVRCHLCDFEGRAGVSLLPEDDKAIALDWTEEDGIEGANEMPEWPGASAAAEVIADGR